MAKKTKKGGTKFGFNNNGNKNAGNSGGGGGGGRRDRNAEPRTRQNRDNNNRPNEPPAPRLSAHEIRQSQQEATISNFSSSELTYNGSDKLVFITDGEPIKTIWKRILRKNKPLDHKDVKMFISSALVASDNKTGYEVEEIVTELGDPDSGVKKLREIMNFPSMSCDAGFDNGVLSFQHVILPLLGLFTRTAITECILEKYVLAIYTAVYENLDSFLYNNVMKMLETLVQRNSVCDSRVSEDVLLSRERYTFIPSSLGIFFLVIVRLLTELLRRISDSSINETMHNIANDLYRLKIMYQESIEQQQFAPTDPLTSNLENRKFFFMILEKEMKIMDKMLNNGRNNLMFDQNPEAKKINVKLDQLYYKELARRVDAERTYDPPGELSNYGKRHDNDFSEISKISIIPTNEEILCDRSPFLPTSHRYSLHFLPDGANRLLDTQFRLLREDLLNPIRGGLSNLLTALLQEHSSSNDNNDIKLSKELKKIQNLGGRFSYNDGTNENSDLQVYTNIRFVKITCDKRKGFACTIKFTPPKISAKNARGRKEFWERSKRLLNGSLVAVILSNPNPQKKNSSNNSSISNSDLYLLYFGVVVTRDEKALSKDENFAEIDVNFIDPSIYSIALNEISNFDKTNKKTSKNRFMVESTGVYLESYYHILKTLQTTNPSSLPFEKYLAPNFNDLNVNNGDDTKGKMREEMREEMKKEMSNIYDVKVENPLYTRAPGFQFDLSILCKNQHNLQLNVADESTHDEVVKDIVKYSNIGKLPDGSPYGLDETQAKALISSLTREIALVEGPPGTGKTVIGVQLMKVLLAEENRKTNIGPILTICFTNHALDQFLEYLLDENITNIVRLGSRSKSERIKKYSLDEVCRDRVRTRKEAYLLAKLYEEIEKIEGDAEKISRFLIRKSMGWNEISDYLKEHQTEFFNKFNNVSEQDLPSWVLNINGEEGFQIFKKKYPFDEWLKGSDITTINKRKKLVLNPPKSSKKKDKIGTNQNIYELLNKEETKNETGTSSNESQIEDDTINWIKNYNEPMTDRPLEEISNDHSIWRMSVVERKKLHDHWRTNIYKGNVEKLSELRKHNEVKRKEVNNIYDEGRRQVLLSSDVIGVTTNSAAKFHNIIRSIGPRIIICEEAGEVLEAHILCSLTPSTQHLILIGDHNQLRPHIATYSLNYKNIIVEPDQFEKVSPDGGCNENCNTPLPCGHICKFKCHIDNPEHIGIKCNERCLKINPECNHQCQKRCFENCGGCEFLVGNIILPGCGHELKNAKCWQDRAKDSIKCKILVPKKLLHCEHYQNIYCSDPISTNEKCIEKCRKQLECGHECLSECGKCQNRSKQEGTDTTDPIERTQHGKCQTVCDKLLFCGHKCKSHCHKGKECPPCKDDCTVICEHASCNKRCLEPCAVCAEKCSWECEHQGKCELSCGFPCYRLPCNERCDKILECGHNCAGVCGEICPSKDFCVDCAPEVVKNQVSDINSKSTFSEIDWNEKRMVVLTCRHVYTMETMDMIMEMKNYYEGSIKEGWKSVKILPALLMNAKTCPTCRTPIKNVKRYGRIINKYTLDMQNKKFLLKYDSHLKEIIMQIITLRDEMIVKRNILKNALPKHESRPMRVVLEVRNKVVNKKLPEIISHTYFENIGMYHGFDRQSKKAWVAHVNKLLVNYQKLVLIAEATNFPPHKKAFDAVLSLYRDNTLSSISSETFQEMLSRVGTSIPQVDRRIYLDAFFEIVNVQKILHREILFIIQELSKESTPTATVIENTLSIKEVWKKFIERLQLSINNHLNTIGEIAESTHYGRHLLLVNVEILEFDLILFTYQLRFSPNESTDIDDTKSLQERITEKCEDIKKRIVNIIESQRYKNSEEEFKSDIHARLVNLLENCNDIENWDVNSSDTLNIEELLEIHQATKTEFKSSEHWYECPNGHPYTIEECDGAMQMNKCPDCNEQIGGEGHQLVN
ncbi:hypothetical protein RhiirA1_446280 [Rhizophagus irregularis]|uniref:RZ-type domain-containing protein n=1 Tax=Rhizophagus irregularis TaxID=588596 RepID=A0A2N0R1K6_9GLOM|nr:hypothetical protein RhiirA1_446280 [Rhizophagus irregularis]